MNTVETFRLFSSNESEVRQDVLLGELLWCFAVWRHGKQGAHPGGDKFVLSYTSWLVVLSASITGVVVT